MWEPEWPDQELRELHALFLRWHDALDNERGALAEAILAHCACRVRLEQACLGRRGPRAKRREGEAEDLVQQASLILLRMLRTRHLKYEDQGPGKFGPWIWTACSHAAAEARRALRPKPGRRELRAAGALEALEDREYGRERVLRLILLLSSEQQDVLFECIAGLTLTESASRRDLSISRMFRMREAARDALRKLLDAGALD